MVLVPFSPLGVELVVLEPGAALVAAEARFLGIVFFCRKASRYEKNIQILTKTIPKYTRGLKSISKQMVVVTLFFFIQNNSICDVLTFFTFSASSLPVSSSSSRALSCVSRRLSQRRLSSLSSLFVFFLVPRTPRPRVREVCSYR